MGRKKPQKEHPKENPRDFKLPVESEAVCASILDALPEAILLVGPEGRIRYLNRVGETLLGFTRKEIQDRPCREVMCCEACSEGCALEQAIETGEGKSDFETVFRKRDGGLVNLSGYISMLREGSGRIRGSMMVFRDVSETRPYSDVHRDKDLFKHVVGKNHKMREIYELLPEIAKTKSTVLIEGESGTGKELLAHTIHNLSPRRDKPFIRVNCGALAEGILESEIFGHVKGAFTGAVANKIGRFELADGGTIFLDEIGDISLTTQVKLLRVLQEEEFERVGDTRHIKVDVRVIAATHKDLVQAIQDGEFRPDLYYRLRVMPIRLPPLRERREDIPLLINHFLDKFNREFGREVKTLSTRAMDILLNYSYPGNIRELENIIEHAMVLCTGPTIQVEHLPMDVRTFRTVQGQAPQPSKREGLAEDPLKYSEREVILKILRQTGWNYQETARLLGKSRVTLWRKMRELGITAPRMKRMG